MVSEQGKSSGEIRREWTLTETFHLLAKDFQVGGVGGNIVVAIGQGGDGEIAGQIAPATAGCFTDQRIQGLVRRLILAFEAGKHLDRPGQADLELTQLGNLMVAEILAEGRVGDLFAQFVDFNLEFALGGGRGRIFRGKVEEQGHIAEEAVHLGNQVAVLPVAVDQQLGPITHSANDEQGRDHPAGKEGHDGQVTEQQPLA